jgi:anti-sigma factor RsiW
VTCRECADFLADYVAGDLPSDELAIFERHLKACANCEEYMRQYRTTILAGRVACMDPDAAPDLPEELIRAILAARKIATERTEEGN